MKVPLFPKTALGVVTLDGQVVTEGSVINTKGTLLVNCGGFSIDSIRVWNGDTEWTAQSVSGRVLQYYVSSNGNFTIRTSEGRILLSFSVTIPQDFDILHTYSNNNLTPTTPGDILTTGTYTQIASKARRGDLDRFFQSTGESIVSLPVSGTNNVRIEVGAKASGYGNDYSRLIIWFEDCEVGKPCSVFIGNVLVLYVEEITN